MNQSHAYVPALRFRSLTRFYDPLIGHTIREKRFKRLLVEQVRLAPGQRLLDLGCGTATLTILLKQACPGATIVGLDGDPEVLALARAKAEAAHIEIELREGMAFAPPFEPASFDRVVSSLLFHHLAPDDKRRTLTAVRGLLRAGGELHVADWGRAQNPLMRVAFLAVQLLDGSHNTKENVRGGLAPIMEETGFARVEETQRMMTVFGTISLYRAATS